MVEKELDNAELIDSFIRPHILLLLPSLIHTSAFIILYIAQCTKCPVYYDQNTGCSKTAVGVSIDEKS